MSDVLECYQHVTGFYCLAFLSFLIYFVTGNLYLLFLAILIQKSFFLFNFVLPREVG